MLFQYTRQNRLFPEYTLHSFFRYTELCSHNLKWGRGVNKDLLAISFEGEMRSQKQKWIFYGVAQIHLLQNLICIYLKPNMALLSVLFSLRTQILVMA